MIWLNADQVASRLSVSRKTALAIMQQMPHSVIGGNVRKRIRVSESTFDAWMVKKSNKPQVMDPVQTGSKKRLARR